MAEDELPLPPVAERKPRTGRIVAIAMLAAFVLGAGLVGWLAWSGKLNWTKARPDNALAVGAVQQPNRMVDAQPAAADSDVTAHLAQVEQRLARIQQDADAAESKIGRAEAMLTALAVRRAVERGAPLGALEARLQVSFGAVQPDAVEVITTLTRQPVTLSSLLTDLDALSSAAEADRDDLSTWQRMRHELGGLFIVRRAGLRQVKPADHIMRAKSLLGAGQIDAAIAEVEGVPRSDDWLIKANRYSTVQRALDSLDARLISAPTAPAPMAPQAQPSAAPEIKETSKT